VKIPADFYIAAAMVAGGVEDCALHNADIIAKDADVAAFLAGIMARSVQQSRNRYCR